MSLTVLAPFGSIRQQALVCTGSVCRRERLSSPIPCNLDSAHGFLVLVQRCQLLLPALLPPREAQKLETGFQARTTQGHFFPEVVLRQL